ncbi:MAG TPA: ATP-binding cassette domain-containing protein [Micromonosporaceae bacterium]|nr:ATP-binding cassette domain-containing protein [Micromonosporaceae bacterium]
MTPVIEIQGLRKTFWSLLGGRRTALDGFDMVVESGQVHGFLGPNGSGKTTTLRTLLGLLRAEGGRMAVLGQPAPEQLPAVVDRIGAIVESPQFFANFTGRKTLQLLATAGGVERARVDAVLDQVGLRDRADDRVKSYSLGMKQRLAVASALLKQPELLILDEPANGLDPGGIREMRDLMSNLAASGVTVLVSSHLLAEIQLICDHVTIISRGRRVAFGPVSEVLSGFDHGEILVRVDEPARAAELLRASGRLVHEHDDHLVVVDDADPADLTRTLGEHNLWVRELTPLTPDLESVFLQLTDTEPVPGRIKQIDESVLPPPSDVAAGPPAARTPAETDPVQIDLDRTNARDEEVTR